MRQITKVVLGAFLIVGVPVAASAVPATVETDLNIRLGPSTGYAVLDTIPGGAVVDAVACYQGWCQVIWDGIDGFASRAYLDIAPNVSIIAPPSGAILAPGIVVYESRYYTRPIWSSRGSIIRQAIRRDIRRDRREVRQERREDRREVRRDRREDRQDVRQRREDRAERLRDVRTESLRNRRNVRSEAQRETRVKRQNRVETRERRVEGTRRSVQRPTATNPPRAAQEQRRQRREVRQERRQKAGSTRQRRDGRSETTGRR
jgi:uncharacterized protein YraI